jgi:6-hydroxytryprostatin B O-methyltransferase
MALNNSSLQELAAAITSQVSTITQYLEKNGLPQPSFAVEGPRSREFSDNPEIEKAYMELVESASDLLHLALGPEKYLTLSAFSVSQLLPSTIPSLKYDL